MSGGYLKRPVTAPELALLREMDPDGIILEPVLHKRKISLMRKLVDNNVAEGDPSEYKTWDTSSVAYRLTDLGRRILKQKEAVPPTPPKLTPLQLAMLEEAAAGSVIDPKDYYVPEERRWVGITYEEIAHVPGMLVFDSENGHLCHRARVLTEKGLLDRKHTHRPNPGNRYQFYALTQAGRDALDVRQKGAIVRAITD